MVIGLFLDDLRGDVALAAHRIDRHDRAHSGDRRKRSCAFPLADILRA
jgi:hypothetical protein